MDHQSLLNDPEPATETAAQAFTRLADGIKAMDGRVAMMSRAVENVSAERSSIDVPDYSKTLEQMNVRLAGFEHALKVIAAKPAMQLTPENLAARINAAAEQARRADNATLREVREGYLEATRVIHGLVPPMRSAGKQRRRLMWTAGGCVLAGCLLWSFLPGVVLRALPQGWHMPEAMAAHIIGAPTSWDAGTRLMQADSPQAWTALTQAADMLHDNQEAIEKCQTSAVKARKPVHCEIEIESRP